MKKNYSIWLYLFFFFCLLNLSAEFIHSKSLIYATKPLLMIFLSIYFYLETRLPSRYFVYIFCGFIFSFWGDTFLMFVENDAEKSHFFLLGLGSFLLTHFFYLLAFLQIPKAKTKGLLVQKKWIVFPFLFYFIGNSIFLWSDIPSDLQIAVLIYSGMIVMMAMACLNLKTVLPLSIFKILFLGVLLFVVSDSIIGLNKFKAHEFQLPYPRLLIMIPYLMSQYLIARASIQFGRLE